MAKGNRLSGLDSSFLHLERDGAHMHVAACSIFSGRPPSHDELASATLLLQRAQHRVGVEDQARLMAMAVHATGVDEHTGRQLVQFTDDLRTVAKALTR